MARTLLARKETTTSCPDFNFKWELYVDSTTTATTKYYIYTYLKWKSGDGGTPNYVKKNLCPVRNPSTGDSEDCTKKNPTTYIKDTTTLARMRYNYRITYKIGNTVIKKDYSPGIDNALPNDTAKLGVVKTGHLHMKKGVWYQWGAPYTNEWTNNGTKLTIGVSMLDLSGFNYPKQCPANGSYNSSAVTITRPKYSVKPSAPVITLTGTWDTYKITWPAVANAVKYAVQASINGGKWFNARAYSTSRTYVPDNYYKYYPGTKVSYRIVAANSTDEISVSNVVDAPPVKGGVKIKKDSRWQTGAVFIKVNGSWKKADYVKFKHNGIWQTTEN